jgi:hypothetical protein
MSDNCKIKKQQNDAHDEILARLVLLENENKKLNTAVVKLTNENKKLRVVKTNINNTTHNNTKTVNNTINNGTVINATINLVGYGSEDLTKLDKADILKALQSGYNSTLKLTEAVHFNPKHPEYHNVYISNMKDKYAMMYDGNQWTLTTKEDLISKIYEDKKTILKRI